MSKTNAIRILESRGIAHRVATYEVDEDELDAVSVARKIGVAPERVFKTLVAVGDKTGHVVFVIPGDCELDLKKAARASGNKKVEMIRMKELLPVTGYVRGGCSPIGMKRRSWVKIMRSFNGRLRALAPGCSPSARCVRASSGR